MEQVNSLDDFGGNQKLPNANATLVLGIISIATCWIYGVPGMICGIIAIVLYKKDKKAYDANPSKYLQSSFSNAKAGFICGIIGLVLSALLLLYVIFFIAIFGAAISGAASSPEFQDALREAMENQQ